MDDGADLGGRGERVDESHSSCELHNIAGICFAPSVEQVPAMSVRTDKQRMLRQRIEQIQAEEKVAQQQLASYRAYQQRELDEVRQATAELNRLQLPEWRGPC